MNISVKKALKERGDAAKTVIRAELLQMLEKKVWHPVYLRDLTYLERLAIIRSQMFLKDKFNPDGTPDKTKARLVAGGNQQNKQLYENLSAPTVATSSLLAVVAIAAAEHRIVTVMDIGGAYLNAPMTTGVVVHMRLDPIMSAILCELNPSYTPYLDKSGCIVVALDMALYGCIESASLWFDHLSATLISDGYVSNPHDVCVFNKYNQQGVQCTATLHVDDILAASTDSAMLDALAALIQRYYKEYKRQNGSKLNYLGMQLDFSVCDQVSITMLGYVADVLATCRVQGTAMTPATEALFDIRDPSVVGNRPATAAESKCFHSEVAKLLYLAKRTCPELLTTVAFLSTRVTVCDLDDLKKLQRMLQYLRGQPARGIRLSPGNNFAVKAWVDAAYGVHSDGKSHTGSAITLGERGTIHAKSAKQKNVTKSSTEAELVGLSDSANQGFHLRDFIIAQGHKIGPLIMYQDNLSTMAMLEKRAPTSERTRHIAIRNFWLKERVEEGEAKIVHMPSRELFANILTKPLQGQQFKDERFGLSNW